MAKVVLYLALFSLVAVISYGAPERRGVCLSMCGPYGVKCPSGYDCKGNGCGHQCYRSPDYVQPEGCVLRSCPGQCLLGFTKDSQGCDTCECDYSALHSSNQGA
ncbi:uncharacterized protein LOC110459834 [Mizuhopecten yessoensis]|uniref:Antistasin-like domain-containing protein n=1 Tax=Mizuhopecten yessoensis TaxID=6573 RepID=A0A210Q3X2_MIZYE|nr:uncharacterized protein LOC110459834 [Mizuhopecten yessoensis]XP_021367965.1 uncharacterized protein LOC110459834 [Mizuhopecten yessoensis]OWF43379.1 hypothetical protein KP79_PYT10053 [Mizuhopecten yessoensis]